MYCTNLVKYALNLDLSTEYPVDYNMTWGMK